MSSKNGMFLVQLKVNLLLFLSVKNRPKIKRISVAIGTIHKLSRVSLLPNSKPRQDRSVNTFHVNSQVASLYASIAAVGTLKWLFAGMNKLVVLYFAVFYRLAAKVADYLSEPNSCVRRLVLF